MEKRSRFIDEPLPEDARTFRIWTPEKAAGIWRNGWSCGKSLYQPDQNDRKRRGMDPAGISSADDRHRPQRRSQHIETDGLAWPFYFQYIKMPVAESAGKLVEKKSAPRMMFR